MPKGDEKDGWLFDMSLSREPFISGTNYVQHAIEVKLCINIIRYNDIHNIHIEYRIMYLSVIYPSIYLSYLILSYLI